MNQQLNLYYDEEGDFLEFNLGKISEGKFRNCGEGIFERIDAKTNTVTGIAIMGFKKRTQGQKEVSISLPVNIELTASN